MESILPKESGNYLKVILGSVNVTILDQKARYDYKDQYEQFKLIVNLIGKFFVFRTQCTMLQKLSKCEVKTAWCGNSTN